MAASRPNRWLPRARAGAFSVALLMGVGLFALAGAHHYAPGDLSPAHAREAKQCRDCHVPWRGATADRCFACHRGWPAGKQGLAALHQTAQTGGLSCWRFHTEHSAAGLTRPFDHSLLPAGMAEYCVTCHRSPGGAVHEQSGSACARCHDTHAWRPARCDHAVLPDGGRGKCAGCHQPPADPVHPAGVRGCDRCHGTSAWSPAQFDHADHFALTGDHAAPCVTCHPSGYAAYTCFGCHEHTPERVAAEHAEEGIADTKGCARCHRAGEKHEGGEHGGGHEGGHQRERQGHKHGHDGEED